MFGTLTGFTSLAKGGNVYIDHATPGGITQTQLANGRAVGIAVSATDIQISTMRKRQDGVTIPAAFLRDGFIIGWTSSSTVTEIDPYGNSTVIMQISGGATVPVTIPVRVGYTYSGVAGGLFYPLING